MIIGGKYHGNGGEDVNSYTALASWYDALTGDVPYGQFADFYEKEFRRAGGDFHLLLDLCCGTGTLTALMARRGYEMIGVDASVDMLMQAREKAAGLETPPLFLQQDAASLDLYGTVDAAYCSLDGMNYLPAETLLELFRRLRLFIRPGGLLLFDLRTPDFLKSLDGQIFVDEKDGLLCLWRADYDEAERALVYGMDLFAREKTLWRRSREEHVEYAHEPEGLNRLLLAHGFSEPALFTDAISPSEGRLFFSVKRL